MHIRFILIVATFVSFFSCNSEQKTDTLLPVKTVLKSEMDSIHVPGTIWCFHDTSKTFFESVYKISQDTSEVNCMNKYEKSVTRKEDTLLILLDNKQLKKFVNNSSIESDNYTTFRFLNKLENINYYLLKIEYYEGYSYLMLNAKTGHENYLCGYPSLSPDHTKLIAGSFDLQAGFVFNGLQLYTITPDSLQLQWNRELSKWGTDKIVWINNHQLAAEHMSIDSVFAVNTKYISITTCN